jgi:ribonuclease T2
MPAMLEPWIDAVKGRVQNAAASLQSVAPQTTDAAMPSLRTISKLAIGGAQVLLGGGQQAMGTFTQTCEAPQLSCHNTTVVENLCCFNAPGGQLLQTQFWDTNPPTGPSDSWTLHGLWYASVYHHAPNLALT